MVKQKTPKKRLGRRPLPEALRRDRQPRPLFIKLTPTERDAIDQAAARAGKKVTEWARQILFANL